MLPLGEIITISDLHKLRKEEEGREKELLSQAIG